MALSAPTAWLVLEYHGKKAWKKTLGSWNQHCREWCEQSINQSLMHPYPQLMMIITIIIIQKKKGTDKKQRLGCAAPSRKGYVQVEWDTASLSSSPCIQRASSVLALSGLPSDSG